MITLNLTAKGTEQELIKKYLEENASETLAEKINNGVRIEKDGKTLINKKTLDGFMKYATGEARKQAEKGASAACVRSDVVFGWAIHYFEEESIIGKLYNEDGSEYKVKAVARYAPNVTQKVTKSESQSSQLSLFDFTSDTPVINDMEETIEDNEEETLEETIDQKPVEPIVEEDPKGSPLYQKYMAIQNEYPDYVVCMRVGDFYEVFGYGAVQVSELIELTLTSRDMGFKHRVPMVGFPYHRADVYYDKLTDKGLTLVIAENDDLTVKSAVKGTVNVETGEVIEMPEENNKEESIDEKRKREEKELIAMISTLFGNDLEVRL